MAKGDVHKLVDGLCYIYRQTVLQEYIGPCQTHGRQREKPGRKPKQVSSNSE